MRALWRDQILLVLVAGLVFFTNLGGARLFDEDEPKNAACGREMFARGDWVVPTFNEELRTDKPVLLYWLMIASYHLFGVSEFAARFWSALLAVGTVLMTYHLGRLLFGARAGLLAGIALSSSLMYVIVGRAATPDATLIFCTTLALLMFVRGVAAQRAARFAVPLADAWTAAPAESAQPDWRAWLPGGWWRFVPVYAAMGLAVLAKGPVGVVLPCAVIGLFLLCRLHAAHGSPDADRADAVAAPSGGAARAWRWTVRFARTLMRSLAPRRVWDALWSMRPLTAVLIIAAIALPWYVLVGLRTDGAWLWGFLGNHNVGRFLQPMERHSGPIFYYVPAILVGFFPWSVFLWASLLCVGKAIRRRAAERPALVFVACWAGMYVGFFSLAQTKLPNYVLPAYPALALLMGYYLDQWQQRPEWSSHRLVRWGLGSVVLVATLILIGLPVAAKFVLPGMAELGLIGLVPLVGAAVALWHVRRWESRRAVVAFAVMSVAFIVTALGLAAPAVSRLQEAPRFAAAALDRSDRPVQLAIYDYFTPNLVFYARQRIDRLATPEDVRAFLERSPQPFVVLTAERLDELRPLLPDGVTVVARQRRFLRRYDVVLLTRETPVRAALADEGRPERR